MPPVLPPPIPPVFPEFDPGTLLRKGGYFVLPNAEVKEVIRSANPKNHVVAMKYVLKENRVILIRGDMKTFSVPCGNWPVLGSQPDFTKLSLEDLGLTIKAGPDYKLDALYLVSD